MEITDLMVETALAAEHDKVVRNYVDKPFWYSDLEHSERVMMHDGMRAALEAVADDIASVGWERSKEDHEEYDEQGMNAWGPLPDEPTNPYIPRHGWKEPHERHA